MPADKPEAIKANEITTRVSYDAVTTAEGETQELLSGLVISILSKYRGNSEAAVTRRTQLLAPIVDQEQRLVRICAPATPAGGQARRLIVA